jgi:uncharacterized protein (TIGR03067 family)
MFESKLQVVRAMLLAVGVTGLGVDSCTHAAPADEQAKKTDKTAEDQKNLQGTWIMMTEEDQGRTLPEETLQKRFRLVIEGAKWTLKENQGSERKEWNVKLDSTRSPKQGDFTYLFGNNKGKVAFAIYELKGDALKLCIADPGERRPKKFDGKGKNTLILFKRTKSKGSATKVDKPE